MSENTKKFVQNSRLILIIFVVEKLLGMVNMTWVEVLVPLYILLIFYVVYFIYKDLKTSQATLQATKEQTESNQKLIDKIEQLIVTLTGGGKNNGGK